VDRMDELDRVDIRFWHIPNRDCAIGVCGSSGGCRRLGHSGEPGGCRERPECRKAKRRKGCQEQAKACTLSGLEYRFEPAGLGISCLAKPRSLLSNPHCFSSGYVEHLARSLIRTKWAEACRRKPAFSSLPGREKRGCANRTPPSCYERDMRLETGDCGLRIADCGLRIAD